MLSDKRQIVREALRGFPNKFIGFIVRCEGSLRYKGFFVDFPFVELEANTWDSLVYDLRTLLDKELNSGLVRKSPTPKKKVMVPEQCIGIFYSN